MLLLPLLLPLRAARTARAAAAAAAAGAGVAAAGLALRLLAVLVDRPVALRGLAVSDAVVCGLSSVGRRVGDLQPAGACLVCSSDPQVLRVACLRPQYRQPHAHSAAPRPLCPPLPRRQSHTRPKPPMVHTLPTLRPQAPSHAPGSSAAIALLMASAAARARARMSTERDASYRSARQASSPGTATSPRPSSE